MKPILMFKLKGCPHCRQAEQYMAELMQEHQEYQTIPLRIVDENEEKALANRYDYYYVPTYYVGEEKMAEGILSKADIKAIFEAALCH